MDLGIKGKYALVTGGSHGIGLATAHALAREGCHVALTARKEDRLNQAVREIKTHGVEAVGVSVLSDKVDIANARLTFSSGCVANITASRVTGKLLQKTRFFGVEGYHAVDFSKRTLVSLGRKVDAEGKIEIIENSVEIKAIDPLEEEIKAFLRAVADRTSPQVSGKDGRKALELALRINDAIDRSRKRSLMFTKLAPAFAGAQAAGEGQFSP